MANGENDTTWGTQLNTVLEMIEDSISGRAAVTHDDTANYTLTTANGTSDEARCMIINVAGALGAARNVVCPTSAKLYVVKNATTGGFAFTFKTTAGTGISVPNGKTMILFCDGTNVVEALDQINGNLAVAGLTVTGNVTLGDTTADTFRVTSDAIAVAAAGSGGRNSLSVTNLNNTASSRSSAIISVAGTTADDADLSFIVTGTTTWSMGLDNSDSDKFKISASATLGTSDIFESTTGGYAIFTSSAASSTTFKNSHATTPQGLYIQFTQASPDNNTQTFLQCDDGTTARCYIYSDGDLQNHDNSYGAISDERLKQDIVAAGSQWEDVKALARATIKWRDIGDVKRDGAAAKVMLGLGAQTAEKISPGLVIESPETEEVELPVFDEKEPDIPLIGKALKERRPTGRNIKGVQYSLAYMKALKALGEAMERIEQLEARLAAAGIK